MVVEPVLFDLGGTSIYSTISVEQFYSEVFRRLGLSFRFGQISAVYEEVHRCWKRKFLSGRLRTREAWLEFECKFLKGLGAKGDLKGPSESMQIYCEDYPTVAGEKLFPETKCVLSALKDREIRLGVVLHRPLSISLNSLEKHAMKQYFQCVISPETANAGGGKVSLGML